MLKTHFLLGFLIGSIFVNAQSSKELLIFKRNNTINSIRLDSTLSFGGGIIADKKINYLAPLANAYANEKDRLHNYKSNGYFDNLSQTISFLGDYKSVLECLQLANDSVDKNVAKLLERKIEGYKGAYLVDAKSTILQMSKSKNVVMINEAHCRPEHRAFVYSLLDEFYLLGFRYLAMEALNNLENKELQRLTVNSGYYTCEPLGGELIRKALRIGLKLVAYEDTSKTSNGPQRDSAQAMHLYEIIKKNPSAKILVFAGYGHIEKIKSNDEFIPMGYQFKQFSKIEPLCIDQTFMSEEGNNGFSSSFYNLLQGKYPAKTTSVLLKNGLPVMFVPDEGRYDLKIIHPPSTYYKGRATWYSLNNERKPHEITILPKNCFLIQAYYVDEWKKNPDDSIIPTDQTYLKYKNKSAVLFLRKGTFKIVFRDMNYKILSIKNVSLK